MLVSHRRHALLDDVCIELHRVLAPTWIARYVRLGGVAQDEHLTSAMGKGTAGDRARLKVVLRGHMEVTVGGRFFELTAGDFMLVPRLADVLTFAGDDMVLEIDWDAGSPIASAKVEGIEHGRLRGRSLEAATSIAVALAEEGTAALAVLRDVMPTAARSLAALGLPLDADGFAPELAQGVDADMQRLFDAIDATLTRMDDGPAVVELEAQLGWSRRTVSRRTTDLHARYGLSGVDGQSWRAVRDFYRLLLGTIFASHPDITTRQLATVLGYASPDALCHAFANAGLPSPGSVKKLRRAA